MTLTDLANHICEQCGMMDADDLAAAKMFLQRRLEMIWNKSLWRDSLVEAALTINPDGTCTLADSFWIPSRATLGLPNAIQKVVAVRASNHALSVASLEKYYRTDTDWLDMQGDPTAYQLLAPVVWEFETPTPLSLSGDNDADFAYPVNIRYSPDGVTILKAAFNPSNPGTAIDNVLRLDAASFNQAAKGDLAITSANAWPLAIPFCNQQVNLFNTLAQLRQFNSWTVSQLTFEIYLVSANAAAAGWWDNGGDYGGTTPIDVNGGDYIQAGAQIDGKKFNTIAVLASYLDTDRGNYVYYVFFATPIPGGATSATLADNGFTFTTNTQPMLNNMVITFTLPPAPGAVPTHQRIRLTAQPQAATTLRILGKTACPMMDDYDAAPIKNAEPCLMAFARADLLLRARQYGKASVAMQEGTALLQQLTDSEAFQQASGFQVQPEGGFSDDVILWTQPNSLHPL